MEYKTSKRRRAYYRKRFIGKPWKRRKYFREYRRRNAARLKASAIIGFEAKAEDPSADHAALERARLDREAMRVKIFITPVDKSI